MNGLGIKLASRQEINLYLVALDLNRSEILFVSG